MNLLKSTGTFGFYTIISRLLGYLRDILIAIFLGTGLLADAFFVAFRIPNTFRRLFSEGTLMLLSFQAMHQKWPMVKRNPINLQMISLIFYFEFVINNIVCSIIYAFIRISYCAGLCWRC